MTLERDLAGAPRRLVGNLGRAVRWMGVAPMLRQAPFWLRIRLGRNVPEIAPPRWLGGLGGQATPLALLDVLRLLAAAAVDPRVAGVVLRLEAAPAGFARTESLRRALLAVRAAGKPVVVWSESYGTRELWLASAGSWIALPASGSVHLLGVRFEGLFLRGLLERLGLRAEVLRVGDFKSAAEILTREGYSEESRAQLEALAEDLFAVLVRDLADGRGLSEAEVRAQVECGVLPAARAREARLVDACLYPDELRERLRELAPRAWHGDGPRVLDARGYLRLRLGLAAPLPLLRPPPRVAYVVARGTVRRGRGLRGIGADEYRELLEPLAERRDLAGVVLRIDSPGGEAVASDLLWRAVRRIADQRPVVVSMGDVAASGGYFMAAGATAILAEATTLTGSIGVVAGKLDASRLYERIGIGRDAVERGPRSGMESEARGFTAAERKALRAELGALYEVFLARVAEGRGRSREEVHALAQGRVWSGSRARGEGLVDGLGGPLEALEELRVRAGLGEAERWLLELHPRLPRIGSLRDLVLGSET